MPEATAPNPRRTPAFKALMKKASRDSADFGLLASGDRILVGVSGGEDSLMLMHLLKALQRRLPFPIEVRPAVVDLGHPGFDRAALERYCAEQGWSLIVHEVEGILPMLENAPDGTSPCVLCSRIRRGKLHGLMDELGFNKLALGQHLDDLCASFLISLFRGGGLKTMGPNVPADGGKYRLIRPLWGCRKALIHEAAVAFNLPKVRSCPYEERLKEGDRHHMGELLAQLEARFPDVVAAMRHSMGDIRPAHLLDRRFL